MRFLLLALLCLLPTSCKKPTPTAGTTSGDGAVSPQTNITGPTLAEARKAANKPSAKPLTAKQSVTPPPPDVLNLVNYPSDVGPLAAYVTPSPKDGKRHPAIIWITGGDCNSIDDGVFEEGRPGNDQSAIAFRRAGIVTMYPSLRGGNTQNNQGKEGFYGEVDDVIAAAKYLASLDYIDSTRIYLGGHSTGGTMALLVSEYTHKFRAVLSLGPAEDIRGYGNEFLPPGGLSSPRDFELRSPILWLHGIKSPTFVLEGSIQGNTSSIWEMKKATNNPNAKFMVVNGGTHFSIVQPMCKLFAKKILADTDLKSSMEITQEEIQQAMQGR